MRMSVDSGKDKEYDELKEGLDPLKVEQPTEKKNESDVGTEGKNEDESEEEDEGHESSEKSEPNEIKIDYGAEKAKALPKRKPDQSLNDHVKEAID